MVRALLALIRDDRGLAMVEYALIAAVVAVPLIAAGYAIIDAAGDALSGTGTNLTAIGTNPP